MTTTQGPKRTGEASDDDLIASFIDCPSRCLDPGEARVVAFGYPIWILIDALVGADDDRRRVARDYELPEEAVRAAVVFYHRHREAIDARIHANAAAFGASA